MSDENENEPMTIESVMHPFPHSIGIAQNLEEAKDRMREHNIRHLPVCKAGEVKGIITDRDINFAVAVDKLDPSEILVSQAYVDEPYIVAPNTPIDEVARRMAHDHIGCALVVDDAKLVGIFTTVDACRTLAELLSSRLEQ